MAVCCAPLTQRNLPPKFTSIIEKIAAHLEALRVPCDLNEERIATLLGDLEKVDQKGVAYWLTLARLAEAALLCAGHYADNCEYCAAGDLLLNPRRIRVHLKGVGISFVKHRHGRLSRQLADYTDSTKWPLPLLCKNAECSTEIPALLPDLYERLVRSACFHSAYLIRLQDRMRMVAETICFLAAWQVTANESLYQRLKFAEEQREFIEAHLCRFGGRLYRYLGALIDDLLASRFPLENSFEGLQILDNRSTMVSARSSSLSH